MVRRLVATVAAVAAVVALAACGDEHSASSVGSDSGNGSGASSAIQELTAASFGHTMAAAQAQAKSAHLSGVTTLSGQTIHMSGDVEADGTSLDQMQVGLTMSLGPGKKITVLLVDRAFYFKASGAAITKNPAKPWVKVDLDDPTNPFGAMFDQMMANFDPAKVQRMFSAITRLNNLGVDHVNGVPARHYAVTVDTSRMVSVMGLDKVPGVSRAQLLAELPDEITSQVWLDAQNRPVKTRSAMEGATAEMTFSDWGKPVSIKAPPAAQVLPFSQVSR